jgi:uncharacterized paraquat-inducible protein A
VTFDDEALATAHRHSIRQREEIIASGACGCFYCEAIVNPAEIRDWIDENRTALCPRCGVDALIGDKSGFPATNPAFLKAMHQHWFEG